MHTTSSDFPPCVRTDRMTIKPQALRDIHSISCIPSMSRSNTSPTISQAPPPRPISASLHSRSLSQSTFFSLDSLPPLSLSPYRKTSPTSSISDSADLFAATGDGLQKRQIHRRSRSYLPPAVKPEPIDALAECSLGRKSEGNVGDDLFDTFLNLDCFGVDESTYYRRDEMDSRGSGNSKNGAYNSESEAESCAIDCAQAAESAPAAKLLRHFRSISMDGLIDKFNFCEPGSKTSNNSSEFDSMDGTFSLEFGSVGFNGTELKKIMADKRLEQIALADPKRAKRILANRYSAARSKERKIRYISELESKVQTLQTEATMLSTQLTLLQVDSVGLATQNNELKIRLQAMEQQAQLKDALNEALTAEVQRLRSASAELDESLSKQMKQASFIKS